MHAHPEIFELGHNNFLFLTHHACIDFFLHVHKFNNAFIVYQHSNNYTRWILGCKNTRPVVTLDQKNRGLLCRFLTSHMHITFLDER